MLSTIGINKINNTQIDNVKDNPTLSADEILITKPENITYTEPMSGYYPATYGFENDEDGTVPDGWIDGSQPGCSARVASEYLGHNKVVHFQDTSGNKLYFGKFFSAQSYGTIELWVIVEDTSYGFSIRTYNQTYFMFYFGIGSNKWQYVDSTDTALNIPAFDGVYDPVPDTWYHLTIHFRCEGAPVYEGLNENKYKIIIDGIESGELEANRNVPNVNHVGFTTFAAGTVDTWVDAMSFSWDDDYTIGDNFNEGLLLSYENNTSLEWQGYSLDGQTNKTILGNTTIPFPTQDGVHTIQVFGNNSGGVIYESDVRYFTTQIFNIITPENIAYTEPMNGYYPATYGFENDEDGTIPQEWVDDSQPGCSARVASEYLGHNKVVHIQDTSGNKVYFTKYTSSQTNGTIQLWILVSEIEYGFAFRSSNITDQFFYFGIGLNKWLYTNNTDSNIIIPAFDGVYDPTPNTWYHLTIHFRCDGAPSYMGLNEDRYKVIIDGIDSGELEPINIVTDINALGFTTSAAESTEFWFDSFGYSWDSNYNIGDNFNEGLLLSYENSTSLEWQGYSLDGQENKTILGNTTIPMPTDGTHFIQVFGNNSEGIMYESNIRYFTVDTYVPPPIPYITIITPENKIYTEPMSTLFLSFETNTNLDWIAYSLDGQANITITGNTTIPMPTDGVHFIQVFGNNSEGIMNGSNMRYFITDTTAPIISGIEYMVELELYSYYPLSWIINDISGGTYKILKNNIIESAGSFQNTDEISIIVDTDEVGYFNYTIIAIDSYNHVSTHVVIVKIISEEVPNPNIPGFNILILFAVVPIATGIIIKFKFKNKK